MSKQPTQNEWRVIQRAEKVWEEAQATYMMPEDITFVFRLVGNRTMRKEAPNKKKPPPSGMAMYNAETKTATVFINREAIKQNPEWVKDDVVPHEIAHVICFMYPHLGVGHDEGWQEVSKRLGGTGNATFENQCDLRITKPPRYIYVVPGVKDNIYLSPQRHNYLQSGEGIYRFKESGIEIRKEHYTGRWL